jgi:transposase
LNFRARRYIQYSVNEPAKKPGARIDADLVAAQFDALGSDVHREALREAIRSRDVYRRLTDELREKVAKLELGLIGPKSQRFKAEENGQLSLAILAQLLGPEQSAGADAKTLAEKLAAEAEAEAEQAGDTDSEAGDASAHRRPRKPTGRRTADDGHMAKATVEIVPDEVKRLGTDAFERIGEERATTVERRVSTLVEVTVVRPKYKAKTEEAVQAVKDSRAERGTLPEHEPESWITICARPELPIEHGMAGPGLLANLIQASVHVLLLARNYAIPV